MFTHFQGSIGKAALFMFISAFMHLLAPFLGGFSNSSLALLPVAFFYALLGYFLMRGFRSAAWINYLVLLVLIPVAYGLSNSGTVPYFWNIGMVLADILAFIFLFVYLFQSKKKKQLV